MEPQGLLKDKVAIVTGAASGLGLGIAKLFHSQGASVVIADISEASATIAQDLGATGPKCICIPTDVTKMSAWEELVRRTISELGGLHIVVNNAGWSYKRKDSVEVTEQEYDRVFDINFKSIFHSARATIPHFISQNSGSIVNISSCITNKATTQLTWYGATKGAVDMITRHLATEYSSHGIRVNAVAPSISDTPLMGDFLGEEPTTNGISKLAEQIPVGRICGPKDIAKAALYFASGWFNEFQTGMILRTDGGTYA